MKSQQEPPNGLENVGLLSSGVQYLLLKETEVCAKNLGVNIGGLKEDCKLKLKCLDPGFAHYK